MPRFVTCTAFALLSIMVIGSAVSLLKTRLPDGSTNKPYLFSLPDLSSPRATLETLITNGDIAARDIFTNGVPWAPTPAMLRMMDTINVVDVAAANQEVAAALAASQLKDVLRRIALPPLSEVPDATAVKEQNITEWHLPGTPIAIAKVTSGPRTGQFLFSQQTVALAAQLYEAGRGAPYIDGLGGYAYEDWRYMPGPLIPRAAIAALPAPLRFPVGGQAIWQWIGLALLLAVSTVVALRIVAWGIGQDARAASIYYRFGKLSAALAVTALSFLTFALIQYALKLWGGLLEELIFILELTAIASVAWFIVVAILRAGELIIRVNELHESSVDGQLVRVISQLLAIGAGVTAGLVAADFIGIPVGPLLAGLGIGGLAVALAVRPTLENVIGGLTLFADRPARAGEYCRFGSESGTVEEIGLRTTKIRRVDDTIITIPNAELAQVRIENYSRRRKFHFNPTLRLRYETTEAQLQQITKAIETLLAEHNKVLFETECVRLAAIGEYALELEVRAYVDVTRMSDFAEVREELNLRILDIVRSAGTNFAFPSQTNYLTRAEAVQPNS